MNSVSLVQSNVDSLPPPGAGVRIFPELPAQISSPVLPSPNSPPPKGPTTKRLATSVARPSAKATATWLVNAMRLRWKSYRERLDECQSKPTAESVHELRVAIRRLISQLVLVNQIFPARRSDKVRKMLKRQLESLGDLRDTHVQQTLFRQQLTNFPGLSGMLARLERREGSLVRRASRKVARFKSNRIETWVLHIDQLLQRQFDNPRMRREVASTALQTAANAFAEVVARWRLIDRSDLRTIHRTRVAFKKFRYIVEILPSELSGLSKRELRQLAWYQRKMGNIQDLQVIQACVNAFVQRHEDAGSLLKPFCAYLRRRRTRALWSFHKSADELFAFWQPQGPRDVGVSSRANHCQFCSTV